MPVPNIVAAESKTLDEADDIQLGGGRPPVVVWRSKGGLVVLKGIRRDTIRVRMVAVTRLVVAMHNILCTVQDVALKHPLLRRKLVTGLCPRARIQP